MRYISLPYPKEYNMTAKILGAFDAVLDVIFTALKKAVKYTLIAVALAALYFATLVLLGYSIVR